MNVKGEVVVDDGTSLHLTPHEESVDDLSWMDQPGPRDIRSLDVSGAVSKEQIKRLFTTCSLMRHLSLMAVVQSSFSADIWHCRGEILE